MRVLASTGDPSAMSTSSRSSAAKHADTVLPSWRNFSFFDARPSPSSSAEQRPLPPSLPTQDIVDVVYVAPDAEGWSGPRGALVIGLRSAEIRVVDAHTYAEIASWKAHDEKHAALQAVQVAPDAHAVVSVGTDATHKHPQLRVWRMEAHDTETRAAPTLLVQTRLQHGPHPSRVNALAVQAELALVAAGFEDGKVLLIRDVAAIAADGGQLRVKVARDAAQIDEPDDQAESPDGVTALTFVQSAEHTVHLLIATVSKVLRYTVLGAGAGGAPAVVDTIGCAPGCAVPFLACAGEALDQIPLESGPGGVAAAQAAAADLSYKLVLARDEAIYVVGFEGREASIALEGPKMRLHRLHGQLVVLSAPTKHGMGIDRPVHFEGVASSHSASPVQLTVFDLDTKSVTYTAIFTAGVEWIWTSNSDVLPFGTDPAEFVAILTSQGQLFRLEERSLKDKLEQLFRAHLYLLAVQFMRARATRFPGARLPMLPPSAVIIPPRPQDRRVVAPIDMLIADIFRRYGDHLYAKGDFEGAMLQFIKTIGVVSPSYIIRKFLDAQRLQFLTKYLQTLHTRGLANADRTTLLLNCYTKLHDTDALDRFIHVPHTRSAEGAQAPERDALPFDVHVAISVCRRGGCTAQAAYLAKTYEHHDEYLDIQLRDEHNAAEAIQYLAALPPALAELYAQQYAHILLDAAPDETTALLIDLYTRPITQQGTSQVPSPAPVFSHFIGHEAMLTRFCEALASRRWGKEVLDQPSRPEQISDTEAPEPDEALVFDTLLELYLTSARAPNKALYLLYHPGLFPYTVEHALVLCTTEQCTPGIIYLYERLEMVDAVVQHWMDASKNGDEDASSALVATLDTFGHAHPHLYISVLQFLASSSEILARHRTDFARMLQYIDENGLLSPLEVVQLVSASGAVELGVVSDYLLRHVRDERAEMDGIHKLIRSYETEIATKETELAKLSTDANPVVFQNNECGMCRGALALPSVHFMCKHSFHLRCLPEGEEARECPICAQAHDTLRDLQQSNALLSDYDLVLSEVHAADDGFDVIADLFSKQLLGASR